MAFILTGLLFMLIPGTFLGVMNLIELSSRESVSLIDPAWLQAHGHAQVFGWVGSFILGIGFYSLAAARPGDHRHAAGWFSWTMWTVGVTSRWATNVTGWESRVLLPLSAALELTAFLIFFIRVVSSHRPGGNGRRFDPWVKIVMAGSVGFALTLVFNLYECSVLAREGGTAAWPHALDQRFLVLVAWGWLAPFIWGFSSKWLPPLLALRPVHVGRVVAGLISSDVGVVLSLVGEGAGATVLFVLAATLVASGLRIFEGTAGSPKVRGVHSTFPMFVRVAYVWLLVAAATGVAAATFDTSGGIWGASRHAFTVGFVSVMIFSIGQRMLPAFAGGRILWSPGLMFASLAALSIGCALRVPSEILAYQGHAVWAWRVLPVSAVVELVAVTMFAVNLMVTLLDLRERRDGELLTRTVPALIVLALCGVVAGPGATRAFAQAPSSEPAPKAVEIGFQYRGRAEGQSGASITNGRDDGYYLNRLRFDLTLRPTKGVTGVVELQDARAAGYDLGTPPVTFTDIIDLRQAYLDIRQTGPTGVGVRAGRQELAFGDQRLVGALDWANTARSFDGVRLFASRPGVKVDAFVSSIVVIAPHAFDRLKSGETFSGAYVAFSRLVPKGVVEPYVFVRQQSRVVAASGSAGDGVSYTVGTRAAGTAPGGFDYSLEGAIQRGHAAAERVAAWAAHSAFGWTIPRQRLKPRVTTELNLASGDRDPRDGRDQTFDQLYPTGHNKYGVADQMGWRNMRDAMVGVDVSPTARLKMSVGVHWLALATTADGLYVASGAEKVVNPLATSASVGTEVDVLGSVTLTRHVSAGVGVGALDAGGYLVQSTHAGTLWAPYVMWTVKY